ncbi:MAG: hypothetical protein EBU32_07885 [Opitutaceae bacterium]|jgi:hypothetical protein|nr:hypothetical protein [Opitutaceae bacterium]
MKSFLSGRTGLAVSDSPNLVEPEAPTGLSLLASAGTLPSASAPKAGASSVQCVREGDVIKKLIVTCECGKTVEIDCQYTAGAL